MHVFYAVLVVVTAAAHFTFVAYMLLGGFLAVRWPRTIWVHIPVVIWGIAIELINFVCPLTGLERWARPKAGMAPLDPDGFIDHYLTGAVYPDSAANLVLALALLTVLTSWSLAFRARRQRRSPQPAGRAVSTAHDRG